MNAKQQCWQSSAYELTVRIHIQVLIDKDHVYEQTTN